METTLSGRRIRDNLSDRVKDGSILILLAALLIFCAANSRTSEAAGQTNEPAPIAAEIQPD
jgi:hypothetical protein